MVIPLLANQDLTPMLVLLQYVARSITHCFVFGFYRKTLDTLDQGKPHETCGETKRKCWWGAQPQFANENIPRAQFTDKEDLPWFNTTMTSTVDLLQICRLAKYPRTSA